MTEPARRTVLMEGVRIVFRNFAGAEGVYNAEGDRNFAVLIDGPTAESMAADGWNVKYLKQREDEDEPQAYLQVTLKYRDRKGQKVRPPRVVIITSRGKTNLDEDLVELLDWVDISNVDLIVRPYHYNISGRSGVKAYLQSIYVTVKEDELEQKYAEVEYADYGAIEGTRPRELEPGASDDPPWEESGEEIVDAELVED